MATNTKKTELSNSNFLIVILLVSLLVIGGTVLAGKTLVSTLVRDTKVVAKKNTANQQLQKNLDTAPALVASYNALGDTQKTLSDALPTTADFPALIAALENMAGTSGITLDGVTPVSDATVAAPDASTDTSDSTDSTTSSSPQEFDYSVSLKGSYAGLQNFLAAVEKSVRPMKITDINMTGSGTSLTISLNMTTYFQSKASLPISLEAVK